MGIMNFAEILDKAVEAFRKYAKTYIGFSLIYMLITAGCSFGFMMIGVIVSTVVMMMSPNPSTLVILIVLMYLAIIAFVLVSHAGHIAIASQEYSGERILMGSAIGASFKNLHKLVLLLIFGAISFIPVGILFYYILKALITTMEISVMSFGYYKFNEIMIFIFLVLSIIALLLCAVAFFTVVSYALPAAVIEKRGVFSSIKRSFLLVKGNFWRSFGRMLVIALTIYAIQGSLYMTLQLIRSLLDTILTYMNVEGVYIVLITIVLTILFFPIQMFMGQIATILGVNMITFSYYNARFKNDGYDIVLKLKDIQKKQERKQESEHISHSNAIPKSI